MREENAKILLQLFTAKCGCGAAATRFKTQFVFRDQAPSAGFAVLPHSTLYTCADGSYAITESACDAHSSIGEWRDYLFAEAVRELNTEAAPDLS